MKELVVISGKGGTGKTSLTASFAALAGRCCVADCDVDAANLHLVLNPKVGEANAFEGGRRAVVSTAACVACGRCKALCRFDAVRELHCDGYPSVYEIDPIRCEGCGVCAWFCPARTIEMRSEEGGEWFVSEMEFGPFVHARLKPGAENSGRLVALVREKAREIGGAGGHDMLLIDGAPGIGCPVIAAVSGADAVLVVAEPTPSGLHDLGRALDLVTHFDMSAFACVNRYDINLALTERIESVCLERCVPSLGRVPVSPEVTAAQRAGRPLVLHSDGPAARAVGDVWRRLTSALAAGATCQ